MSHFSDQMLLGQIAFDQMLFDQMLFDQMLFDQMLFDQMLFDQMMKYFEIKLNVFMAPCDGIYRMLSRRHN